MAPSFHHITAYSGDPAVTTRFWTEVMGLSLVKQTVNFDNPSFYHLYFADASGTPGTILTFFPVLQAAKGRAGAGEIQLTTLSIEPAQRRMWADKLTANGLNVREEIDSFGRQRLLSADLYGFQFALSAERRKGDRNGTAIAEIMMGSRKPEATIRSLGALGFRVKTEAKGSWLLGADGSNASIHLLSMTGTPSGAIGTGSVHHIAFRAADDAEQTKMADALRQLGQKVTEQRDRMYFRSVYTREPGGVLLEIATDKPGFAVDEPANALGKTLCLPPWLERRRNEIAAELPPLPIETKS
jgi:glyoxalase family protein